MEKIYIKNIENQDKKQIIKDLIKNDLLEAEFIYNSDFKVTKDLREFIEIVWEKFWISQKLVARLILITDELNNNAIEHWSDKNGENILRIKISKNFEKINLNLEVEDNWKWKDKTSALEMETMRAHKLKRGYSSHDSIRWRWLFLIIVKIVDRLYFKDSKKWGLIVWIKKEFSLDDLK